MAGRVKSTRWKLVDGMFASLTMTGAVIEFSQVGSAFIDGLIISRFFGAEDMAGQGIAYPIFSIIGVISGLLAVGMQVTCSQLLGRGDRKSLNGYFSLAVFVGGALSLVGAVLTVCFAKPLAVLLGASGNAAELVLPASRYLLGVGIGIPPLIMVAILSPAIQMDSGRKTIQNGAILCSVTDVIFDLLAVYLRLGILGVGLATALAYYVNLAYLCMHFRKKDRMLHFVAPKVSLRDFLRMLSNGSEKAVKRVFNVIRPVVLNSIIISYGGSMAMSALSIRNNLCNFTEIAASGIASAVSLLVGLYYGEVNEEAISEVKRCQWRYITASSAVICILLLFFPEPIAHLYLKEEGEVFAMAVFAIRALGLQTFFHALILSRVSYLQAICRTINMNLLIFTANLVYVILSAFALGRLFGVYGILSVFPVSDALSLITVYAFYQIKHKMPLPKEKELLNLPEEFDLQPGDVISLDIRNREDVSLGSEQVQLFCRGHGYDPKIGFYAALTFEELAANIVEHGFPNRKKEDPIIDFRAVALEDRFVMRLRDDCPRFDITEHIAAVRREDADPMSRMGIRITARIAESIEYTNAFETNNVIITYADPKKPPARNYF